jgi:hypothetical protein
VSSFVASQPRWNHNLLRSLNLFFRPDSQDEGFFADCTKPTEALILRSNA